MEGENGLNDYSFVVEPLAKMNFSALYELFYGTLESATLKNNWVTFLSG